jgi:hypothetical protein
MNGAVPLFILYVFIAWTGKTFNFLPLPLPLTFLMDGCSFNAEGKEEKPFESEKIEFY